jgi:hypothetical protein
VISKCCFYLIYILWFFCRGWLYSYLGEFDSIFVVCLLHDEFYCYFLLSRAFCNKGVELCWFFVWKKFFSFLVLCKAFGAFFDPILVHIFFGLHIQGSLLVFRST